MFSSHQIFVDSKENVANQFHSKLTTTQSHKGKSQSLKNFKDSTNTKNDERSISHPGSSDENLKCKKQECVQKEIKAEEINSKENMDDFSEIEEMHIYEEPHDNYEDIMPKSERLNKTDIEYFFLDSSLPFFKHFQVLEDRVPSPIDLFEEPYESFDSGYSVDEDKLYDDSPLEFVPLESLSFNEDLRF